MSRHINRRDFISKSALGALGLTLLPSFISRGAPSDRLRIAHIGLNGMGNNHLNWFAALPDVDIVALCDVDQDHLNGTLKKLKELSPIRKRKAMKTSVIFWTEKILMPSP